MSEVETAGRDSSNPVTDEEMRSALFAQLVMQQTNLAMMLLGKVPHPESGGITKDLEAARLFIDQLEMLEGKTKGNLTPQESGLLKQSLMGLRMAFVEAVETSEPQKDSESKAKAPAASPEATPPASAGQAEESHKKFSKKY